MISKRFIACFVAVLATVLFSAGIAGADEFARVIGKVQFERRATLVPMVVCESGSTCAQSTVYWAMVIHDGETTYEVDQAFDEGRLSPPESVSLAGIMVHPGENLVVDGVVDRLDDQYAVITHVTHADLIRDAVHGQPQDPGF